MSQQQQQKAAAAAAHNMKSSSSSTSSSNSSSSAVISCSSSNEKIVDDENNTIHFEDKALISPKLCKNKNLIDINSNHVDTKLTPKDSILLKSTVHATAAANTPQAHTTISSPIATVPTNINNEVTTKPVSVRPRSIQSQVSISQMNGLNNINAQAFTLNNLRPNMPPQRPSNGSKQHNATPIMTEI